MVREGGRKGGKKGGREGQEEQLKDNYLPTRSRNNFSSGRCHCQTGGGAKPGSERLPRSVKCQTLDLTFCLLCHSDSERILHILWRKWLKSISELVSLCVRKKKSKKKEETRRGRGRKKGQTLAQSHILSNAKRCFHQNLKGQLYSSKNVAFFPKMLFKFFWRTRNETSAWIPSQTSNFTKQNFFIYLFIFFESLGVLVAQYLAWLWSFIQWRRFQTRRSK